MKNFKSLTGISALALSSALLSGCFHSDDHATESEYYAVVATQAGDYSSGSLSLISLEDYSADNLGNYAAGSDSVVSTHGEDIYRIGRFGQDAIAKLSVHDLTNPVWEHSTDGTGESSSNPYKMIVKDDTTAYVIRFGMSAIWVVNPSAANNETFKTGEIDLSSYDTNGNGTPNTSDAILIGDKLYVIMQNLDDTWAPATGWIAVIDTTNNTQIKTNTDTATPDGIALTIKNPAHAKYAADNNKLYVAGIGRYSSEYTGGIESIDLTSYATEVVVDDGDDVNHPYGNIVNLAILNSNQGYFVGYASWQHTNVYRFNPSTGEVNATPVVLDKDVSDIEIGPRGNLWIANRTANGITILDTVDDSISVDVIDTALLPVNIEFSTVNHAH